MSDGKGVAFLQNVCYHLFIMMFKMSQEHSPISSQPICDGYASLYLSI